MRRRSQQIQLIALGSVILQGCGSDLPNDRYVYKFHDQCVQDWGSSNCEHAPTSTYFWGGSQYCYGPFYNRQVDLPSGERIWSGSPHALAKSPYGNRSLGGTALNVSRGGFGSSSQSFFSGGG